MDPSTAVRVRDLVVERGGDVVLHQLRCDVRAGTITGLLGPSGCGKSTLLRAIVGVQRVRSGDVELFEGIPAGTAQLRRRVGYVTQAPSVYPDLTVRENLACFARIVGVPDARVTDVLELVGLADRSAQLVGSMSGGQRGRVSLAVALLGTPDLLVLDEPTVGLDPVLREQLWTTFRQLADDGVTLLVSSHVMEEASRCDRLLLMRDGRLLLDDTPDGLRARGQDDDLDRAFLQLVREQEAAR
jgi:ABC-2 type transport system ATP-binding protein